MRALAILLALLWGCTCPAEDWEQIPEQSRLGFVGTLEGEAFEGVFHRFTAGIRFDPKALENARFSIEIDVASADTKNRERDLALKQEEWFHTARFPRARYRAEKFRSLGGNRFVADGILTIKGVSREFSLPFRWRSERDHAELSARVSLRRTDFNIGEGEWADDESVGRTVQVRADLRLRRVNQGGGRKQLPDMAPQFCSSSRRGEGRIARLCNRSCNTEDEQKGQSDRGVVS